ncbi:MAG: hypothetical protein C4519_17275 [Desulfobacteraceae bacterium]|nr:MAG: hypothetical protein C4519_17275 [Desulfobacteraceae bacterium]
MTHTLNRRGLSEDRPGEEIVFLAMAHRKEKPQKAEAMRQMARTVLRYGPKNIIGAPLGLDPPAITEMCARAGIVTAVFTDKEDVLALVRDIKSQKLGVSVVLSALFSDVRDICTAAGIREHTYNVSLGIFGKTEKLPDEQTLRITTQCGHGLVSPHLVNHILKRMNKGKMTSAEGAQLLVKPCVCGIGNPQRFKRLLDEKAAERRDL